MAKLNKKKKKKKKKKLKQKADIFRVKWYIWYIFTLFDKGDNFCGFQFAHQFPSEKWSTQKGKNLLPVGVNSSLLE